MERYELEKAIKLSEAISAYYAYDSLLSINVDITFIKTASMTNSTAKSTASRLCSLRDLNLEGIPKITDVGFTDSELFFACKSVTAKPIQCNIDAVSLSEIIIKACSILAQLHQKSLFHGNISTETLLLDEQGNVILSDIGLASCEFTPISEKLTSLNYYSPERILSSRITASSDLYALGSIIYKSLTGHLPFEETEIESQLSKIFYQRPRHPREIDYTIPKRLETICLKLLEKNQDSRYQSANQLSEDLVKFVQGATNESLRQQIVSKPFLPLIGRTNEIEYFRNILQRAFCENGTTLDLTINSGMGNSRLIQEFRTISIANGAIFIHTSQDRTSGNIPAISAALNDIVDFEPQVETQLGEYLAKSLNTLSPHFVKSMGLDMSNSELIRDIPSLASDVARMLCDSLHEKTVVFAFENVTDYITKEIIQKLSKFAESKKVIVIVTHPSKTDITKKTELIQRHELSPLTQADLSILSSQLCATKLPYDEIHELKKITGGNPYHATLLLSHLVCGEITSLKDAPRSLREVQEKNWTNTSELGRHLLLRISLLGKPTNISFVQMSSDLTTNEFTIALNELINNGFVKESISGTQSVLKLASESLATFIKGILPKNTEFIHYLHMAQAVEDHIKDYHTLDFELGELYLNANNCSKSALYLIKALKTQEQDGSTYYSNETASMLESCLEHIQDPLTLIDALIVSIKNQIAHSNPDKARKYSHLLTDNLRNHQFGVIHESDALTTIAKSELFLGDYPKALTALNKNKTILENSDYIDGRQEYLKTLSNYHLGKKEFTASESAVQALIDLTLERQDRDALFDAYCMMSDAQAINKCFEEAIIWLQKALSLAKNINNIVLERKAIDFIVQMQFQSGNLNQAIDALKHTINIEKDSKGFERQAQAYVKICKALLEYSRISELRTVLASFGDFLHENETAKYMTHYYMYMIRLAVIDTRFNDAFEMVRILEDLALSEDNPQNLLKAMQFKGEIFFLLGDHSRAESMLELAFELFESQDRDLALNDHVSTCYMISKNFVFQNKLEQAREYFYLGKKSEKELIIKHNFSDPMQANIAKLLIQKAMYCSKETPKGYSFSQSYFFKDRWISAYEFAKSVLDKRDEYDIYNYISLVEFILITSRIIHDRFMLSSVKDHEAIVYSKYAREQIEIALGFMTSNGITIYKKELTQLKEDIFRLKLGRVGN